MPAKAHFDVQFDIYKKNYSGQGLLVLFSLIIVKGNIM